MKNNTADTYPTLALVCSVHGPQSRLAIKGLETQHLVLACGCSYCIGDETPHYDGTLLDGTFDYTEAREMFVACSDSIEIHAAEYFKRLETIGNYTMDVEQYDPEEVRHELHTAEGVFTRRGTKGEYVRVTA